MRRRNFIVGLASTTATWPLAARKSSLGSLGRRSRTVEVADDDSIQTLVQRFNPRDDVLQEFGRRDLSRPQRPR
jgi:hypothetical protein